MPEDVKKGPFMLLAEVLETESTNERVKAINKYTQQKIREAVSPIQEEMEKVAKELGADLNKQPPTNAFADRQSAALLSTFAKSLKGLCDAED